MSGHAPAKESTPSSFYHVQLEEIKDPENLTEPPFSRTTDDILKDGPPPRPWRTKLDHFPKKTAKQQSTNVIPPLKLAPVTSTDILVPSSNITSKTSIPPQKLAPVSNILASIPISKRRKVDVNDEIQDDDVIVSDSEDRSDDSQLTPPPNLSSLKSSIQYDLDRIKDTVLQLPLKDVQLFTAFLTNAACNFAEDVLHKSKSRQQEEEATKTIKQALKSIPKNLPTCAQCRNSICIINVIMETEVHLNFSCKYHQFCNVCSTLHKTLEYCPICAL